MFLLQSNSSCHMLCKHTVFTVIRLHTHHCSVYQSHRVTVIPADSMKLMNRKPVPGRLHIPNWIREKPPFIYSQLMLIKSAVLRFRTQNHKSVTHVLHRDSSTQTKLRVTYCCSWRPVLASWTVRTGQTLQNRTFSGPGDYYV